MRLDTLMFRLICTDLTALLLIITDYITFNYTVIIFPTFKQSALINILSQLSEIRHDDNLTYFLMICKPAGDH